MRLNKQTKTNRHRYIERETDIDRQTYMKLGERTYYIDNKDATKKYMMDYKQTETGDDIQSVVEE